MKPFGIIGRLVCEMNLNVNNINFLLQSRVIVPVLLRFTSVSDNTIFLRPKKLSFQIMKFSALRTYHDLYSYERSCKLFPEQLICQ